uniref:Uncharacterized protein n=1 Tax=Populus alba TaxID=43335 RepID=A0A4U5QRS5_POPAL|nr:hypothetical protein D5086_0000050820 [Populus alba]
MGDSDDQTTHFVFDPWFSFRSLGIGTSVIENSPAVADGWQSVVSSTAGYEAFMKSTAFLTLASPEDLKSPDASKEIRIFRFMIEHNEVKEVMEIPADHMAIASRPKELCRCLLEFARKHA